jgi:hypothetical protein
MATTLKYGMKSLAIGLSLLGFFHLAVAPAQAQTTPTEINIVVVQGEGAINNVRQKVASEPIIRVEDEAHRPVTGAAVVFTLPTEGATGTFGNGGKTLTVMTDTQGRATAQGLKVNEYPGKLVLHINVSYRGLSARTNITQFDEGPPVTKKAASSSGGHGKKVVVILVLVGAAAGGGAYFALHKSGGSSSPGGTVTSPTSIGLTPGSPTIIGPH